ncbi:MAG: hypothetical protein H7Y86_02875 [Rhizobacter sp.]|nr:hypothetical protein [Ferruginibacter sp.]
MKKVFLPVALQLMAAVSFSQNVGIGETAPTAAKLQVKAVDSSVIIVQNSTAAGTDVRTGLFFKTGPSYSGSISTIGTSYTHRMGFFTFGGALPEALLERLSITDLGNVGIGVINPLAKLEVNGQVKITGGNPGIGKILESDANGLATWVVKPSGGALPTGLNGNTLRHNGTAYISTANLHNDGSRIGIGTTTPGSMLEIKAGAAQTADIELNATAGDNAVLRLNRSGLSGASIIRFKTTNVNRWDLGTLADEDFKLTNVSGGGTAFAVDDVTSNIGIGTNDYSERVNVNGNIGAFGAIISKSTGSNGFLFSDRTANAYGGWIWYADAGKANLFRYGGLGNALTVDATGKVGLGIASPAVKLDVAGRLRLRKEGAYGSGLWIDGPNQLQESFFGMEDDDNMGFYSNTAGWMHHFNVKNGTVRIGTMQTATGYMLNVGGRVIAEEVRVQLKTAWPDYVFSDNYLLKPLEEVEQFIKANKHLPGIPSAAEIEKNGQHLGEVQSRLVEKVEELTLYILTLNKELAEQRKELDQLKRSK